MTRNRKCVLWLLLFIICIAAAGAFCFYMSREPAYSGTFASAGLGCKGGRLIGYLY